MNWKFKACGIGILWSVLCVGCEKVGRDRPASHPQGGTQPEIAEAPAPSPDAAPAPTAADEPPATTESDGPSPDAPEEAPPPDSEEVVEDLDEALQEVAELERDTEYFAALTRVRKLLEIYRDREEGPQLRVLHQRLHRDYRTASGLDFAVRKLGEDTDMAVSVATSKLLDAGEVGLVFLRKAVREAEPMIAFRSADILMRQGDSRVTQLIVERMEQDPRESLGDDLGKLLQRLDDIEPEWIDRLCVLAKRSGSGQAGALSVLIDRLETSIRAQLKAAVADDPPDAAETDASPPPDPAPVEVDESLVRTLYEVAETTEGPVQRRSVEALVLVLDEVHRCDGESFNQLFGNADAYGFVGDYVVACLGSEKVEDRVWAIAQADAFGMKVEGLWAQVRLQQPEKPEQPVGGPLLDERLDPALNFADLAALTKTGPVEQGQTIRFSGFVDVPSDGKYTFSVDCEEHSPTNLYVDGEPTTADEPVDLSAGWHDLRAETDLSGDQARVVLSWSGPDLEEQSIPAERLACADRTRMLIWRLGRSCDLPQAREFAEQLLHSIERVDQDLPAKLTALTEADCPARPAIAGVLAEVLDYSTARRKEPPEWELPALTVLLPSGGEIEGPEQLRVVASLVNHLVRRADGKIEEFNRQAESVQAYDSVRAFVVERLDAEELSVRLWAAEHAEPFSLLGSGLEGSYFDKGFQTRVFDRVDAKLQFEPGQFGYPDERNDNMGIRWSGLITVPADGTYVFSSETNDTCRLWLDDQPVLHDVKKPATVDLTAGLHEIRIEYVEMTAPDGLAIYWQPPGDSEKQVLGSDLKHVDSVRLLVDRLTQRPDDPQAVAWLAELSYKADRLATETSEELIELAAERPSWQSPLASVAAAVVLRDPRKAPASAVPLLAEAGPAMKEHARRRVVQALAAYFSVACGSDKQKFQQAAGSDKTYDFLCEEVQSVADSVDNTDTAWAQDQARLLGLKISTVVHQEKDGRVFLHAKVASLHGTTIKYETGGGKDNLGFWTNAEDFASWRLAVEKGGTFDVSLTWSCEDGYEGSEFVLAVADQQLAGKVAATGDWAEFQTMNLGTIKLGAGAHQLSVKAKAMPNRAVMNLQSITLEFQE